MSHRIIVSFSVAVTSGLAVGLVAPVVGQAARPHAQLYTVTVGAPNPYSYLAVNTFAPNKLTIHAGDSVRWTNLNGSSPQTVSFGPTNNVPSLVLDATATEVNPLVVKARGGHVIGDVSFNVYSSGALWTGGGGLPNSYTFTFPNPGVFLYRSLFHPADLGEIDVVPAGKPVSPSSPDRGDSYLQSFNELSRTLSLFSSNGVGVLSQTQATIVMGFGSNNVSVNAALPENITVPIGTKVTWMTSETSGDLHAVVFNPYSDEKLGKRQLFLGRSVSGGLALNPDYSQTTLASGANLTQTTLTFLQQSRGGRWTSGYLYGSSPAYSSAVPSSYTLTFSVPGSYPYADPFHPSMGGTVTVISPTVTQ